MIMRRVPSKRRPRLRPDAPIPPEMFVAMPPFLDALVFVFATFVGAIDDVFNTQAPFLGQFIAYVASRVQYRASLYLQGIRWFNIGRIIFGGAAMLTDLLLWEFFQPVFELVVTAVWIAAVPWRDAPLSCVFTRHRIVKKRVQLVIDTTTSIFEWPFTFQFSKTATKTYQIFNGGGALARWARKSQMRNDADSHLDAASFFQWTPIPESKVCRVLYFSYSSNEMMQADFSRLTAILDANGITYECIDLSILQNYYKYYGYVEISRVRDFPQVFIVGKCRSQTRYVSVGELTAMAAHRGTSTFDLDPRGTLMNSLATVFAGVPRCIRDEQYM